MKTLQELHQELNERLSRVYGSDMKLIPNPGQASNTSGGSGVPAGYRKVRARAMTFEVPPDSIGIRAPGVGDSEDQDKDRTKEIYAKYYKKYMKSMKKEDVDLTEKYVNEEPPYILVLKRQNVRLYPGNIKVALYHNEKLNKVFSVPFNSGGQGVLQAEDTILNIDEQKLITSVLGLFCTLTEENKQKMFDMLNGDNESYNKIKTFALDSINESNTTDHK